MVEQTETTIIEQKRCTEHFSVQDHVALFAGADVLKELTHNADGKDIHIIVDGEPMTIPNADLRNAMKILVALGKVRYVEVY